MEKVSIKDRLYELSTVSGDSQIEIARKSNIPKSSMSLYFNGKRIPRQDIIGKISDAYGIDPAWLMGYDVPMRKNIIRETAKDDAELLIAYRKLNAENKVQAKNYINFLLSQQE